MQPAWLERYGNRVENYRFPKADAERQQLAATIGADGFALLQAAYAPEAPPEVRWAPAVEVLRQIWVQQYYGPEDTPLAARPDVPPAAQLIHSPYDLDARYSLQHGSAVGYKAHATETCDDDTPHVITHVETTPATTPMTTCWNRSMRLSLRKRCSHGIIWSTVAIRTQRPWSRSAQDDGVHIVGPGGATRAGRPGREPAMTRAPLPLIGRLTSPRVRMVNGAGSGRPRCGRAGGDPDPLCQGLPGVSRAFGLYACTNRTPDPHRPDASLL